MNRFPRRFIRVPTAAIVLAGMALLGGCGQTGPLYLPQPKAKPAKSAAAPASAPVPQTVPGPPAVSR